MPYADLGRPAVTLWEHRLASKRLHEEGHRTIDEHAIFMAIEEQRSVLAQACDRSKAARRALARSPGRQKSPASQPPQHPTAAADDPDAKVPVITADDIAKTEFWS